MRVVLNAGVHGMILLAALNISREDKPLSCTCQLRQNSITVFGWSIQ
ncbi:hypothetical protein PCH70_01660 [Pseudomonas cichorii JBC1]|nr:hypothetical protein PCH70_01660 [Pseudomonas cichorii JBC1]